MKKNNAFRRAAALMAALSITVSLAAPAFAGTYYIDNGDITVTKNADGSQTVEQNGTSNNDSDEIIITTTGAAITTLESDLEGPAAEDSDFGPVVEDNYQSAQPESTEESEDADQPEIAEEPKSADRQESADQQAAPAAAAPAAPTSVITLINNFANKVLNLTLKDVKIDVSNTGRENHAGKAALSVQGKGNVEIELDGENELKSGAYRAGLEKNNSTSAGTLTLKDDNNEAGSLTATGGFNSAGIGGGYLGDGKNITITGSTNLSENEIQRAMADAAAYEAEDSRRKERLELHNQAEVLAYKVDEALSKCKKELDRDEKNRIKTDVANLRRCLRKDKPEKMNETEEAALRQAKSQLEESANHLMMLYAAEQGQDGSAGGSTL